MTTRRLDYRRVMPLFALTFVDVLGLTVILPLLHLYALAYNATPLQIGMVAAAFPLAQIIGVPVMGALSDRYGRKPLLLISQISTFISFLMLAAAGSLEIIILSRLVDGLFGANLATAQAAITDLTDDQTRAQGLGLTGAAFGLGFVFGPAISLGALEFSHNLATPALIAAAYSFVSILLTTFGFQESLPPSRRRAVKPTFALLSGVRMLRRPRINHLLLLMFFQQVVFFAFESLLGLFVLSRLGIWGGGNSLVFIYVGFILIYVQARLIGKWRHKYGERALVMIALAALTIGLLLLAATPAQPQPFYIQRQVEDGIRNLAPTAAETVIGSIPVSLPDETQRGVGGLLWFLAAAIPLTIGAGLIRPALNNLMVKWTPDESGTILGVSASVVSLADVIAPLLGGYIFQTQGASAPFALGGAVMLVLLVLSIFLLRHEQPAPAQA
jgi:DHA1 family tetracycline resistance protein-like MFS transporter